MTILVEVAIIQMRTLKTKVEKGFLSTVIVQELAVPKRKLNSVFVGNLTRSQYACIASLSRKGNRLIFLCQCILSNIKDGNIYINELLHLTLESIYLEKRFAETIQENYLVETTTKETGLVKSAGKEDPVELYSTVLLSITLVVCFALYLWRHSQVGSWIRAVYLFNNEDVQRQAQRVQKSLRRSFLIFRCQFFLSLRRRSLKVSDCSPANRERELGLDRRETVGSDIWCSNWLTKQHCEAKSVVFELLMFGNLVILNLTTKKEINTNCRRLILPQGAINMKVNFVLLSVEAYPILR
ncbi:hypothetical protein POVCU2_0098020 [Plasmodium ovale curtisi]|uniref:Uncharacterized protein n=1 Tax=Plasmodium ovale curtisi TaxID=864141 RepID=A0A1A8WV17_PLAOA|nr:hypothetical protein POVCU2_0098020 [Plasmodium ovale curtisi]